MKEVFTVISIMIFISTGWSQHHNGVSGNHVETHKGVVEEVLQTNKYTYLLVKEGSKSQ